jgi:hypothetical protein
VTTKDAGYPEKSKKLCAHRLQDGSWCTKDPGHEPPCTGVAARPVDTSAIQSHYAQGIPKK